VVYDYFKTEYFLAAMRNIYYGAVNKRNVCPPHTAGSEELAGQFIGYSGQ
jgi:hypothetical protein